MRISTTSAVRCSFRTHRLPTDWYLPALAPIGLLYAQHGFVERKGAWSAFATAAAEAGFVVFVPTLPSFDLLGCTVENLGNNTHFLTGVAQLFADAGGQGSALGDSFGAALAKAGRHDLELPDWLTVIGHSAGGEAALFIAARLAGPDRGPLDLRGVVLADPVPSMVGRHMVDSLRVLAGSSLPVRLLSAPPSSCNAQQRGTHAVLAELAGREFLGAMLTTGSHADILGGTVSRVERLACGTPLPVNVEAARTLALGWLREFVDDAESPIAASSRVGDVYDALVRDRVICTLPDTRGVS